MKKYLICIFFTLFLFSCENSMYKDVITLGEFDAIIKANFNNLVIVEAPSNKPVYIQFKKDGKDSIVVVTGSEDASSKDWHISSNDATWRMSSNSGTTATAVGSGGDGGVKVFKGVSFDSIIHVDDTNGLVNSDWEVDENWMYGSSEYSLNYYLTKGLSSTSQPKPSELYLFHFESSQMGSPNAYRAGTDYTYLIKDGNGGNYVKVQAIRISTDGSGMTFNNRIYMLNYEMADENNKFKGKDIEGAQS